MTNRKEAILESAQALILEKGFTATTLDEICTRAGVTKGSFFHYFKNKEHLGTEVLDHYASRMNQALTGFVCNCGSDPRDRLMGYIDAAIAMCLDPRSQGCLVGTMTQELHQSHPNITCCCGQKLDFIRQSLLQELEATKLKYGSVEEIDLVGVADLFITTVQGGLILVKATGDRQTMQRALEHYRRYVTGLFPKQSANGENTMNCCASRK